MNRYGPKASETIEDTMHEYMHGDLKSGKTGSKVKNRDQAVAIGIAKARAKGYKVPRQKTGD